MDCVKSTLELIVTSNKITHIKFLIENYFDLIKPHLNRLFVVACANGRTNIAEYLLDYGAELSCQALEGACFFGHFETVIMLVKRGLNLNYCKKNLIHLTIHGKICCIYDSGDEDPFIISICYYSELLYDDSTNTFRNDIYNYGNDYVDILKLLITYDIKSASIITLNLGRLPAEFYDINIFRYLILDNDLIDFKFGVPTINLHNLEDRTLLESSIIYEKLDVIEFLLQKGAKSPITNDNAIRVIEINQPIRNILMKYRIWSMENEILNI